MKHFCVKGKTHEMYQRNSRASKSFKGTHRSHQGGYNRLILGCDYPARALSSLKELPSEKYYFLPDIPEFQFRSLQGLMSTGFQTRLHIESHLLSLARNCYVKDW